MPRLRALAFALALPALAAGCPGSGNSGSASPGNGQPSPSQGQAAGATAQPVEKEEKAPFDKASAKTPWKHAEVGDWATYSIDVGGGKTMEMKFEVTQVTDDTVEFTVKDAKSGELRATETLDLREEEERYKDPRTYDALDGEPELKTIDFKGRQLEVLVVKRKQEGLGSTEMWLAEKDVRPFNQCAVKSFKDGQLKMELLDFGSANE